MEQLDEDALGWLHRCFDGAPPRPVRLAVLAGGETALAEQRRAAFLRQASEDCVQGRLAVALRRQALAGRQVRRDRWLARLVAALAQMRAAAIATRMPESEFQAQPR